MSKQYGLILPDKQGIKKAPPIFKSTKNVFGEDSDSDDGGRSIPKIAITSGDKVKRQALAVQEKALEEDPTVYQYDELYDDMEDKKKQLKTSAKSEEKKPKYIEKLLQTAEKRKRDNERRVERQVQKEREEEGDKFADKEAFVTSSYKKKLEEMRLDEEKEQREHYLEEIGDVTKQADLGGFYRHLYEQKLRPEKNRIDPDNVRVKSEEQSAGPSKPPGSKVKTERETSSEDKSKESEDDKNTIEDQNKKKTKEKRTYRKRGHTGKPKENDESDSDDAEVTRKNLDDIKSNKKAKTHLQSNIDADSDFSIDDSSSSGDEEDGITGKVKEAKKAKKSDKSGEPIKIEQDEMFKKPEEVKNVMQENGDKPTNKVDKNKTTKEGDEKKSKETDVVAKEIKPKIDIWKKRTVGEAFDQAVQRYYQRKASRGH